MHSEYLDMFITESQEHLQALNANILRLEKSPDDLSIVGEIFRSAHTLKGMAGTMGFEDLTNLTHYMENVLDLIRKHKLEATSSVLDVVFSTIDALEEMVTDISNGGTGKKDVSELVSVLEDIEKGKPVKYIEVPSTSQNTTFEQVYNQHDLAVLKQLSNQDFNAYEVKVTLDEKTLLKAARVFMVNAAIEEIGEVLKATPHMQLLEEEKFDYEFFLTVITKVNASELEKRLLNISEVVSVTVLKLNSDDFNQDELPSKEGVELEIPKSASSTEKQEKQASEITSNKKMVETNKTIRVNIERLDVLMNLFEELVIDRGRLEQIASNINNKELNETVERMTRISSSLQEVILTMRMMPVEGVFNRFPRMIRQLSKDLKKKIKLEIVGAETELDRTIIDEIGDPLVHLIRNSLDHGIELPEKRRQLGKPEEGTIILRSYHSGNNVFIEIEDDGGGISRERVLKKVIDNGILTEQDAEKLTDQQVYSLIFSSGFSTAETLTDLSGRGVGLDVVKSTLEGLGGEVTVDSIEGKGTIFSIQLPLTLSIIDVLLVELEKEKYAIPLSAIIETAIIPQEEIYKTHNQKVINFRDKIIPLVFLKDIFGVNSGETENKDLYVVIISKGDKVLGLVVDTLIGQQDIVLKTLGSYLTDIFAISGATILGNGQVALIVDTNALFKQ